jgi:hypothetical protein
MVTLRPSPDGSKPRARRPNWRASVVAVSRIWVKFARMRRIPLGALALLGGAAVLFHARNARAANGENELTFDLGAASFGMTHAWREVGARVALGGGGGVGLSPLPPLGATYATGEHFDYRGVLEFAEILHVQFFLRIEPASWFRLDGGARAGFFAHSRNDSVTGGEFVGLFAAPALAWRWLWVGPRVSGNLVREHGGAEKAANLVIEYVMVRLVKSW